MPRRPISTYRVQVRAAFDLHSVAALTDYLADLGIDWVYLSPLLEAEAGSDHGYDVIRHDRVDPARGGDAGLEAAAAAAHGRGLGVLVDIVPNHVGVATAAANPWWWDVLRLGAASPHAAAFDIDWAFGGDRVRIPVLGDGTDGAGAGELEKLTIESGADGPELAYFDNRYPIAPGTNTGSPVEVHARQHYELMHWRRADAELNYRRFFAVNTLAGLRVERPEVFEATHELIGEWVRRGLVDGLRVDHPDGLAAPGAYLDRLAELVSAAPVFVEKIVEGDELLPADWATDGTTGYDALGEFDRVLIDPRGEPRLSTLADVPVWSDLIHGTKRAVADGILRSEVLRLVRDGGWATDAEVAADAIAELLTCFPVYRSYLPKGAEALRQASLEARVRRPDLADAIATILPTLLDPETPAAIRFQQTSGAIMAKGVEDCAFYRWPVLTSLTEVGGDPAEFSMGIDRFHERQERRQRLWPHSMTTLSTHDTKRGEDVRARIDVIAELPAEWAATLEAIEAVAPIGDPVFANLLWQAAVGAWPISRERLHAYAEKASREAGDSTTWTAPDAAFEARMHAAVDASYDEPVLRGVIERVAASLAAAGWSNSLSAKLLQLTAPGVPDVYQGSELWETSLVDPDNRRSVDFALRRRLLAEIDAGALPEVDETGAAKLLVVARALRLRRHRPELFTAYAPVGATGAAASHVVAFDRGGAVSVATRLPVGLAEHGGWRDTVLDIADGVWRDAITDRVFAERIRLSDLLDRYPVALLVQEDR